MSSEAGRKIVGRAARGGMWVMGGRFGQAGLRFVSNAILANMLFPEAFGLMGLVSVFLLGLELFSDTGVRPSIVRSDRGEDRNFLATAWTLQVLRGVILFGLCWLLAGPYSRIYEEPDLARLLPIAGITAFMHGLRSTNFFLADRRMVQGRKVLIGVLAQVFASATMIIWALYDRTVNALLAGQIVAATSHTIMSHLMLPGHRAYFHIDRAAVSELYGFGRWIFLSTALTFLSMQGDRLFLGYALLLGPLGIYFIATRIVELVSEMQGQVSTTVVFPAWMESVRMDAATHAARVQRSRYALDALGMTGLVVLATLSPAIFRYVYDASYAHAAVLAQLLCLPAWFQILKSSATNAVMVYGDAKAVSNANLLLLLVKIPVSIAGYYLAGVPGFIIGSAVGNLSGLVPIYMTLKERGCRMLPQDLRLSLMFFLLLAIGVFVPVWVAKLGIVPLVVVEALTGLAIGLIALRPARYLLAKVMP